MSSPVLGNDVLIDVAAAFRLGEVTGPASYVDGGVSGEVFKVATTTGVWAVKKLFQEPDLAGLEIQGRLQDAARAAGVASPQPMRAANGRPVATVRGDHWLASAWTDVSRDPATLVQPDRLAMVGDIVATLHDLRLEAPHGVTPWLTTPPSAAEWAELRSLVRESDPPWSAGFEDRYPEWVRLADFAGSVGHEAAVLSHCDLGPANFGTTDDHLVVFDWERAGAIPPAQELGYVLIHWTGLGDPAAIVPPIVSGYRSRSRAKIAIGPDMFACAANAFLNFLRSAIRGANERRVVRLLHDSITLDSVETLADLASRDVR